MVLQWDVPFALIITASSDSTIWIKEGEKVYVKCQKENLGRAYEGVHVCRYLGKQRKRTKTKKEEFKGKIKHWDIQRKQSLAFLTWIGKA